MILWGNSYTTFPQDLRRESGYEMTTVHTHKHTHTSWPASPFLPPPPAPAPQNVGNARLGTNFGPELYVNYHTQVDVLLRN